MGVMQLLAVLLSPYCSKLGEESSWSGQVGGLRSRVIELWRVWWCVGGGRGRVCARCERLRERRLTGK